jgi:hypothetical protein
MPVIDRRLAFPTLDTMPFAATPTLPAEELGDRQSCKFTGDISQCDVDGPDLY